MDASVQEVNEADETDAAAEVMRLRREVAQLKQKLLDIHGQSDADIVVADRHPWVQIAATVGVTFALGKLIQVFRLPTAAAVAIPMITSEVNRRYF